MKIWSFTSPSDPVGVVRSDKEASKLYKTAPQREGKLGEGEKVSVWFCRPKANFQEEVYV